MPAYISHAIMGEQLYNELNKAGNIIKTDISKEEVRGYSLGADLAYLSKKLKHDPQNYNTRDFFINIIEYIKENKLTCTIATIRTHSTLLSRYKYSSINILYRMWMSKSRFNIKS